jgi:hypothetical protein
MKEVAADLKEESFDNLIKQENSLPSVFLGNGFSIARYPQIFSYENLFIRAKSEMSKRLASLFQELDTQDFEHVIGMLENGSMLMNHYYSK